MKNYTFRELKKRDNKISYIILILITSLLIGCGLTPTEYNKAVKRNMKYKQGDIVYIKPDSAKVAIKWYEFNDTSKIYYRIQLSNGECSWVEQELIYGK